MIRVNDNFTLLPQSYLFSEIARKVSDFTASHPDEKIIRMGIGDVTRPLCPAAIEAMHLAVDDESSSDSFHGYGPEQGYGFLREAIAEHDYCERGLDISPDDIFISDGAKSDTGNIGDILARDCRVAVTDPVYPVYVDTNVMAGRAGKPLPDGGWSGIEFLPCTGENDFVPALPVTSPDIIYLCFPNNPTGTVLTREQLKKWVDYALSHNALLLFDSAYEAYVNTPGIPRSIYEIEGAERCAIEFRSFSKTAGFTGVRCGYTVVPSALKGIDGSGHEVELRKLWNRRQCTKFNGASYISQRAAEALYSPQGRSQVTATIEYYRRNASMLLKGLSEAGLKAYGGVDSPYIWVKTPEEIPSSWKFFDYLMEHAGIVGTPGAGFGRAGEGYFRLTAFSSADATEEACLRLSRLDFK
ncbi:MAG TPA: LL-diaminopimelate aminotransferase [Porphyromonadaceae bacterium]|nr:LL-diaminopimelate aminotransferase [Paramuribaculum sp.]HAB41682.1 LL-diaminopimelate aminotransferase [Porphyromonadaceae bacterium]